MTGFARCEGMTGDFRLAWRIKSVNHRYLDPVLRLPDGCDALELEIGRLLKERIARGHVECTLTVMPEGGAAGRMELDESLLAGLYALEGRLLASTGGWDRERLGLDRLLAWPGMVRERRVGAELERDPGRGAVLALLVETLGELDAVRLNEGRELVAVMTRLLESFLGLTGRIGEAVPRVRAGLESRLRARVLEYSGSLAQDERLAQELAFLINRQDITEELDRIGVHLGEMRAMLESDGAVGRRLDFLCQELNREANTLCSKAQDGELSRLGVEIKVIVEQLREQAQNLE